MNYEDRIAETVFRQFAIEKTETVFRQLEEEGNVIAKLQDIVKQPAVLEFLGLEEKAKYSESDLETAIINKL